MTEQSPGDRQAQAARVYERYTKGHNLTDVEVKFGAHFYRELADRLIQCGPAFRLAFVEANRVANALEDYKAARKI